MTYIFYLLAQISSYTDSGWQLYTYKQSVHKVLSLPGLKEGTVLEAMGINVTWQQTDDVTTRLAQCRTSASPARGHAPFPG